MKAEPEGMIKEGAVLGVTHPQTDSLLEVHGGRGFTEVTWSFKTNHRTAP